MTRSVDASNDRYLDALRLINQRVARAQREVSTGKRVSTPSDDPDSISALLQVRAELGRIEQMQTNLTRTKTEVDASESALQSAVKLFDRVRSLSMTAASGINTALTRQGIADELKTIIERFTGLAKRKPTVIVFFGLGPTRLSVAFGIHDPNGVATLARRPQGRRCTRPGSNSRSP